MFPARESEAPYLAVLSSNPDDEAMNRFLRLRFADPLTFSTIELQRWHRAMSALVIDARDANLGLERDYEAWMTTRDFGVQATDVTLTATVKYARTPGVSLEVALERRKPLTKRLMELHALFEVTVAATRMDPAASEPVLQGAESEFAILRRRYELVTPAHLALQTHLEHLLTFGMPTVAESSVASAEALYAPLLSLRDEYFDAPRSGLLRTYLETVAAVESTDEFRRLVAEDKVARAEYDDKLARAKYKDAVARLAVADARLPELEAAVEVFALMEE
jgi:hypothetical protein